MRPELSKVRAEDRGRSTCSDPCDLPAVVPGTGAHIDEQACIGCLKCVRACPVDAIIGAAGLLHAVVPDWCIGCGLCLPPCPVDCIELVRSDAGPDKTQARARYLAHQARGRSTYSDPCASAGLAQKQAYIQETLERVRARRRKRAKDQ